MQNPERTMSIVIRMGLIIWVLFSLPLSMALGRMLRRSTTPPPIGWDTGEVARMVSRTGVRSW